MPGAAPVTRRHLLGLTAAAGVGLGVSACGAEDGARPDPAATGLTRFAPGERPSVPRITGDLLTGGTMDSDQLRGSVVVYNIWGSWCGPCREEAPTLRRVSNATRDLGVRFMGVNVRDNDASAIAFERRFGIRYPSIDTATSGGALEALRDIVPAQAVPSTVVVDPIGRVAARVIGVVTRTTLRGLIDDELDRADR